jgi:basic membrane protein A
MLINCGKPSDDDNDKSVKLLDTKIKAGLIVGTGGFGDKSFNDMQYKGMVFAKNKYNIEINYKIPVKKEDIPVLASELITENCNLIIYSSTLDVRTIKKIADVNPDVRFILMDNPVNLSPIPANISSICFSQNEGSFLAGALAAMTSKTGIIAVIGATDITVIKDFFAGYRAGAKYINPRIIIYERFLDRFDPKTSCWINSKGASELSDELYFKSGADIIFGVAAGSNIGIFQSARKNNRLQ